MGGAEAILEKKITEYAIGNDFGKVDSLDLTHKIRETARRMYRFSLIGALPSEIYNVLHPNVSRFAKKIIRSVHIINTKHLIITFGNTRLF